jgi:hypothetical protein
VLKIKKYDKPLQISSNGEVLLKIYAITFSDGKALVAISDGNKALSIGCEFNILERMNVLVTRIEIKNVHISFEFIWQSTSCCWSCKRQVGDTSSLSILDEQSTHNLRETALYIVQHDIELHRV